MSLVISENLKNKNILSTLFSFTDNSLQDNKYCTICTEKIDNPITLSCNHTFCYNCLLESYKGNKCNFGQLKTNRICPYCRHQCSYLPLQEGINPIKGIHREYGKKTFSGKLCCAIIKSGPKAGQKCNCCAKYGDFCGRHKNHKSKEN